MIDPRLSIARLFAVALVAAASSSHAVAQSGPATQPAATAPAEQTAIDVMKAYHALFLAGEMGRAVEQHFDLEQTLWEIFAADYRDLPEPQRARVRELFADVIDPSTAHPSLKQALSRTRIEHYGSRVRREDGRTVVEFTTVWPDGRRQNCWAALHHVRGTWKVINLGLAGDEGFVPTFRSAWGKARADHSPVTFLEEMKARARRLR